MEESRVTLSGRQNPVTFYLRVLLYMAVALLLRVVALLPLAALFVFPSGSALRYLALLCPVLLVLLVWPLRFSMAQALVQKKRERYFSFDKALNMSRYGEKLAESLMHALNVAKWALPLALMLLGAYIWQANTDALSLLRAVSDLGAGVTSVWCAVANFFIGIFGGEALAIRGQLMEGVYALLCVLGLGVAVLLYGMVRNSAYRYIWVVASDVEKDPRAEARRRLRGRRWEQLGVAAVNLLLWTPFLAVVASTLKGVLGEMSGALMNMVMQRKLLLPDLMTAVMPLAAAFVALYMPLLPVRRIFTCFFAVRNARHFAQADKVQINPAEVPETLAVPTTASGAPTDASSAQ